MVASSGSIVEAFNIVPTPLIVIFCISRSLVLRYVYKYLNSMLVYFPVDPLRAFRQVPLRPLPLLAEAVRAILNRKDWL
jgi:hypothetical protein